MVRSLTKRGMPKPFAVLLAALLALYFVPFVASPAQAATVGGFEIEGNLVDDTAADPPIDWFDLGPGSAGFGTGVDNTTTSGQDTTTFKGASKEFNLQSEPGGWPNWQFGTGNATGKSDFGRWATYDFVDANDHVWFFLGFDRGFGTGTAKYAFELNQITQSPITNPNPRRSQGDIRLVIYDQGNGVVTLTADAQNPDVGLYVWDDPDQGPGGVAEDTDKDGAWVKINNAGVFAGASNSGDTPVAVPSWWTSGNVENGALPKDTFLEFGIDLTSFGAVLGCPSSGFSAVNARSITGTGGPGTLVDYLEAIPVTIPSNCANLVINKEDADGNPLGGATFRIAPNPLPVGTPGRPSDNFLTIFDDSDGNTTLEPGTNYDDPDATAGRITLGAVVPDVEYTITEIAPPDGYIGETGGKTVIPEPFGGGSVTFTNTLGSVKFFKSYQGPNEDVPEGATFLLERDALEPGDPDDNFDDGSLTVQDNGANDADGDLGQIKVVDLLTGDYRLTEVGAPTGWVPDGDTVLFTVPGANNTADIVLVNPTFTNPRATYSLVVRKVAADDGALVAGAVFNLYRESGEQAGLQLPGAANDDEPAGTCTTGANGQCNVPDLAWGHSYYWYEVSVPAPYNLPDDRVIGPIQLKADGSSVPSGVAVFEDPESDIVTSASNGTLPAGLIRDSATLDGIREDAEGSITFRLWDNATCTGDPIFTSSPVAVSGPGTYGPVTTTVSAAGDYYWIATYSGDPATGTLGVAGQCGEKGETSTVIPSKPGITTIVDDNSVTLADQPTQIVDHATLNGATNDATGSIEFAVYGPFQDDPSGDDSVCIGENLFLSVHATVDVAGNGSYTSEPVTVTDVGYYIWVASYSGDANNEPAEEDCGEANEVVLVNPAAPTITTDAQQDTVPLSSGTATLTDTATLSGATGDATGTISFSLYGPFASDPGPDDCVATGENENLVGTVGSVEVFSGNGTYTSRSVAVTLSGYYTWVATYGSGDGNSLDATHPCGQAVETTLVPHQPVVSTQISATSLTLAGQGSVSFSDKATLSGATNTAGGTITFRLFGPGATVVAACATTGAVQGSPVTVNGNATYQGPTVSVTAPGYYSWVATYSGDANNLSASHDCGLPSETVQVFLGQNPTLQKVAEPPTGSTVQRGDTIKYTVTVGNTGDVAIDDGVVTDTLPAYVTVDQASVTASGGTFTAGGDRTKSAGTIKWTVDLAPGQSKSFVYNVSVDADAPELATLVNLVEFFGIQRTTTHRVPEGNLTIVKEVSPVAGNGVVVEFGDELTYTLTATASGQQNQTNVVVTDYLPGLDPERADSGSTTYVSGSATCVGAGTCTVTEPGADGLITWSLGSMAAGTSRQVTFKVTIDDVAAAPGETVAVDILNAGAVQSTETPKNPSNEVVTPVTAVFPVKVGKPPAEPAALPRTGSTVQPGPLVGTAVALLGLGLMLMAAGRRRGGHRRR